MKMQIIWSIYFFLGCSLMAMGQNNRANPSTTTGDLPKTIAAATREKPFVNSLGMKFVPVPGTKVLFSIWDTRVQDFMAYAKSRPGVGFEATVKVDGTVGPWWKSPGFKQGDTDPVVYLNWQEAKLFCAWLTNKEWEEGKIGRDEVYRLPTDKEWSTAAGDGKYPWGNDWPPPKGAVNDAPFPTTEGAPITTPVGSFSANQYGLYDMVGNVWQWCGDWDKKDRDIKAQRDKDKNMEALIDAIGQTCAIRGASWQSISDLHCMVSSYRNFYPPQFRRADSGFRCVLAPMDVYVPPAVPIQASTVEWIGLFGVTKSEPRTSFALMGGWAMMLPSSTDTAEIIEGWSEAHPSAVVVPICSFGPVTDDDPNSKVITTWVVDGDENLNVELVRQGCVYPDSQLVDNDDQLKELVKFVIPQAAYDAFAKKVIEAGNEAKAKNLGIWRTDAASRQPGE